MGVDISCVPNLVELLRGIIKSRACGFVGCDVVLRIRRFGFGVFEREVCIVRVFDNCIVARGCSGMEWPYPIVDSEWAIIDIIPR